MVLNTIINGKSQTLLSDFFFFFVCGEWAAVNRLKLNETYWKLKFDCNFMRYQSRTRESRALSLHNNSNSFINKTIAALRLNYRLFTYNNNYKNI